MEIHVHIQGPEFDPWSGKIPRSVEKLNLCTAGWVLSPRARATETSVARACALKQEKPL